MPEYPEDFDDLPWCQAVLTDEANILIPLEERTTPPHFPSSGANRCFAQTLNTPSSIRNYCLIYRPPTEGRPEGGTAKEILLLVSVGQGLDSWDGILNGGIICLLLDNVCAIFATMECGARKVKTVTLETRFRKVVRTPSVLLCRARLVEGGDNGDGGQKERGRSGKGRKLEIRGTVEDGLGGVYAEAKAVFWDAGEKGQREEGKREVDQEAEAERLRNIKEYVKVKAKL